MCIGGSRYIYIWVKASTNSNINGLDFHWTLWRLSVQMDSIKLVLFSRGGWGCKMSYIHSITILIAMYSV